MTYDEFHARVDPQWRRYMDDQIKDRMAVETDLTLEQAKADWMELVDAVTKQQQAN